MATHLKLGRGEAWYTNTTMQATSGWLGPFRPLDKCLLPSSIKWGPVFVAAIGRQQEAGVGVRISKTRFLAVDLQDQYSIPQKYVR